MTPMKEFGKISNLKIIKCKKIMLNRKLRLISSVFPAYKKQEKKGKIKICRN